MSLCVSILAVVFWFAVIPAFLAMGFMIFGISEPERPAGLRKIQFPLSLTELKRLGLAYWLVIVVATVFALARFSEAFLVLRALAAGLPAMLVPAVMVVMSLVYALAAYPAGVLSDKGSRLQVLVIGLLLLVAADVVLAFAPGIPAVAAGVALWGLHMGFTQGLLAALVADTAQTELRGTAFGMLNLLTGIALLVASIIAGALWEAAGPKGTFLAGAVFTLIALCGLVAIRRYVPEDKLAAST